MSDFNQTKEMLSRYEKARIPFVVINTLERDRILDALKDIQDETKTPYYVHTLSKGTYDLVTSKVVDPDTSIWGATTYMADQMRKRENLTFVLTEVPDLSTETDDTKQILDLVLLANETGGSIIVITSNPIWNQLQRHGMIINVNLPNEEEMYEIVNDFLDMYRGGIPIEWDNDDVREVASVLAGITKIEAENVLAALVANRQIRKSDMDEIYSAKDRLFSDISGLERISVDDFDQDIGGLAGLKEWLADKKELLRPEKRDELRSMGLRPPRGILLVGVPGCGKSLSAKSIAASWHLPLYRLDFATVQGSYVGQTERQLREALATAENMSPCVLWIDEIEKGLSGAGSSNDGGVSTRMVGQFLFWLQECRKMVFVVATANDVSKLPSELLRRGRFDELFFIDLPTPDERREILKLYMEKYLHLDFSGPLADQIVEQTEGFTGSDLEATVRDLAYRNVASDDFFLSAQNIVSAFDNVIPLSQTSPEKIESIRDWGKERAVPASGRPIGENELTNKRTGPRTRKVLI